ncbi:MAG: PIN domain-containing protein [Ginsengibacter sp.]
MAYKIFLDTNIIVDLLMERNYELDAINEIFILEGKEKVSLYISESIIATTFYIVRKEKRIDPLAAFREICKTVNVVPFSKDILYYPLEKYTDKEDGLLYFLAYKTKMNYFITRNVKNFAFLFPSLPVMSPTNFLKEIYFNDIP